MTARDSQTSPDALTARPGPVVTSEPTTESPDLDAFDASADDLRTGPAARQARAAWLLRGQASRIVANWVLRAANLPAFRATPNLALDRLQDAIPALLDSALTAIAYSDETMDPEPLRDALELAAEHGRTRADEGFGIGVLLAEYQNLRMEVWAALWRIVDSDPTMAEVPREFQTRLSSTFDALAAAAAEAWVERKLTGSSSRG
jgi:hypothetical protein